MQCVNVYVGCVCTRAHNVCWQKGREHLARDTKLPGFLITFLSLPNDSPSVTPQQRTFLPGLSGTIKLA